MLRSVDCLDFWRRCEVVYNKTDVHQQSLKVLPVVTFVLFDVTLTIESKHFLSSSEI